jgi:hypothetical protein
LRHIRMFNADKNNEKTKILTVCTGLFSADTMQILRESSSDMPRSVRLHYFPPDAEGAWSLVRNAVHAKRQALNLRHEHILPKNIDEAPAIVRYLSEDTLGWPMAAVQLGSQLAILFNEISIEQLHASCPEALAFVKRAEKNVDLVLRANFDANSFQEAFNTDAEGLLKLLVLALSPHSVRIQTHHYRDFHSIVTPLRPLSGAVGCTPTLLLLFCLSLFL